MSVCLSVCLSVGASSFLTDDSQVTSHVTHTLFNYAAIMQHAYQLIQQSRRSDALFTTCVGKTLLQCPARTSSSGSSSPEMFNLRRFQESLFNTSSNIQYSTFQTIEFMSFKSVFKSSNQIKSAFKAISKMLQNITNRKILNFRNLLKILNIFITFSNSQHT